MLCINLKTAHYDKKYNVWTRRSSLRLKLLEAIKRSIWLTRLKIQPKRSDQYQEEGKQEQIMKRMEIQQRRARLESNNRQRRRRNLASWKGEVSYSKSLS
jgi:hypothetical protein